MYKFYFVFNIYRLLHIHCPLLLHYKYFHHKLALAVILNSIKAKKNNNNNKLRFMIHLILVLTLKIVYQVNVVKL